MQEKVSKKVLLDSTRRVVNKITTLLGSHDFGEIDLGSKYDEYEKYRDAYNQFVKKIEDYEGKYFPLAENDKILSDNIFTIEQDVDVVSKNIN